MAAKGTVREKRFLFGVIFFWNPIICQDRLGTNT